MLCMWTVAVTYLFLTFNSLHMQQSMSKAVVPLPQAFKFEPANRTIRTLMVNTQPHFIAKEICAILELPDVRRAVERLDDDEKLSGEIIHSGQKRMMWLINESGLYNLIFRSNKPEAKAFRKWITAVVLPAIRKTGSYSMQPALPAVPDFSILNRVPTVIVNGKVLYSHQKLRQCINPDVKTGRHLAKKHKKECFLIKYPGMKGTRAYFITRSLAEEIITRNQKEVQHGTL